MMYFPSPQKPDLSQAKIKGLQEIQVTTKDGLSLFGWYSEPKDDKPIIVWFHGNASNVLWQSYRAVDYAREGYGVLLAEYRGYSGNPGKPSEEGLYRDGRSFLDWLIAQGTTQKDIVLYAESVGTGVAIQLATEYPGIRALVLEAPFSSALDVARSFYWFVPVSLLMKDRFDNLSKIESVKAQVIIVHGDKDRIIPYSNGEILFQSAREPKDFLTIKGAGHNDLHAFGVEAKVLKILNEKDE